MPTLYNMQAELKDLLNASSKEMASLVGSVCVYIYVKISACL